MENENATALAHTPGPWYITDSDYEEGGDTHKAIIQSLDNGGQIIADIVLNEEANACLIAAAPKLLKSCLALIDRLEEIEQADGIDALTASVMNEAKITTLDAQGIKEEGYNA